MNQEVQRGTGEINGGRNVFHLTSLGGEVDLNVPWSQKLDALVGMLQVLLDLDLDELFGIMSENIIQSCFASWKLKLILLALVLYKFLWIFLN